MLVVHLIRKTWAGVTGGPSGNKEPGHEILQQIFFLCPEIRLVFGFDGDIHRLKEHGRALSLALEQMFGEFGREGGTTVEELQDLGRRHARVRSTAGFKAVYWETFGRALIDYSKVYGTGRGNAESQIAWTKLVCFVIDQLRTGYHEESKKIRRRNRAQLQKQETVGATVSLEPGVDGRRSTLSPNLARHTDRRMSKSMDRLVLD